MGLQSHKSPNLGNFETPKLGVLKQNDIWVQAPWLGTKNIIRGDPNVSPKQNTMKRKGVGARSLARST